MSNLQTLALVLTVIALAQSLLSANILAMRKANPDVRAPLIIFFLANAVTELSSVPAAFQIDNRAIEHAINLSGIPATLLLAPAIWKYVVALTSEESVELNWKDSFHLVPFILGIGVCIAMAGFSSAVIEQIIGDGSATDPRAVVIATILLVGITLIYMGQLVGYILPILFRLLNYWKRLKDLYASTHNRELTWVLWMLGLLLTNVLWGLYSTFFEAAENIEILGELANVALIWMLSVWGLRQLPGLRQNGNNIEESGDYRGASPETKSEKQKYDRSALSQEQIERIASKIDHAMQMDKLHMKPNLSLRDLSSHISAHPNYVSQTLNGELNDTFFDYVNRWRIKEAMPLLRESDEQVTNIAYDVGFNSRSSFYNAFKKETGQTPSQYRSLKTQS